jgi:alpha-beta hydrolase superfamily lysophospholipase
MQEIKIPVADGHTIRAYTWPIELPKAWVHINHGMAEHAKRYHHLATRLNTEGYAVVAHNHRGHGDACLHIGDSVLGHFADHQGWQKVLDDISVTRNHICDDELPYYLMGHSMGSFIVQAYFAFAAQKQQPISGLILSGSNFQAPTIVKAGLLVAKLERWRLGARKSSKLIQNLSFGSYNKAFAPNRTEFDWLSSNQEEVDKYIDDPLCGFECTTQLWIDLLEGLSSIFTTTAFNNMQKGMPIYIFGGDKDPVGENGKGLPKLARAYERAGQPSVTLKLYENGRHEMLNESNSEDVIQNLIKWLANN